MAKDNENMPLDLAASESTKPKEGSTETPEPEKGKLKITTSEEEKEIPFEPQIQEINFPQSPGQSPEYDMGDLGYKKPLGTLGEFQGKGPAGNPKKVSEDYGSKNPYDGLNQFIGKEKPPQEIEPLQKKEPLPSETESPALGGKTPSAYYGYGMKSGWPEMIEDIIGQEEFGSMEKKPPKNYPPEYPKKSEPIVDLHSFLEEAKKHGLVQEGGQEVEGKAFPSHEALIAELEQVAKKHPEVAEKLGMKPAGCQHIIVKEPEPPKPEHPQMVFDFGEKGEDEARLVGGKGACLTEMIRLGLPVPPGFTVTTEAAPLVLDRKYKEIKDQVLAGIERLEQATGKRFGDPQNPLLVSVRSGAAVSMPGIMNTVLDLGLTSEMVENMRFWNRKFYTGCFERLILGFGRHVLNVQSLDPRSESFQQDIAGLGLEKRIKRELELLASYSSGFPQDPEKQLEMAVEAIYRSWQGKKARDYREIEGIDESLGTAVNVQAMVFGNRGRNSLTAVYFTRNPSTGEQGLFGTYLRREQGEALVDGARALPLSRLGERNLTRLQGAGDLLESRFKDMQEIEFTMDQGDPWFLQTRSGKRTRRAKVRILLDMAEEGVISREEALARIEADDLSRLEREEIDPEAEYEVAGKGTPVSPGLVQGAVAWDNKGISLAREAGHRPIILRRRLETGDVRAITDSDGFATAEGEGNSVSHAIVVARGQDKPGITGVSGLEIDSYGYVKLGGKTLCNGTLMTINGDTGEIILGHPGLVTGKATEELARVLELAKEYGDWQVLTKVMGLENIAKADPNAGMFYLSSLSKEQKQEWRRTALRNKGREFRRLRNERLEEYLRLFDMAEEAYSPLVVGLYDENALSHLFPSRRRMRFRQGFLGILAKREQPEPSNEISYKMGTRLLYDGHPGTITQVCCSSCPVGFTYDSGEEITVSSSNKYRFSAPEPLKGIPERLEEARRQMEGYGRANVSGLYDVQAEAALMALDKAGRNDVHFVDYSPGQRSIEIDDKKFEVVSQEDYYLMRLAKAQEAIRNG
jgi:phosphoenolpyruvate synthase/pyruvate phosphate dikinase